MATIEFTKQTPRARQAGLLHTPLNDELVIYDTERNKAHSLNRVASLVWKHCDGQTEVSQLQKIVAQELQAPVDEQLVWLALHQLERNKLLDARLAVPGNLMTRRDAARRLGKAAAIIVPLVASALIPPPVAAGSCKTPGSMCMSSAECCSGLCSSNICA